MEQRSECGKSVLVAVWGDGTEWRVPDQDMGMVPNASSDDGVIWETVSPTDKGEKLQLKKVVKHSVEWLVLWRPIPGKSKAEQKCQLVGYANEADAINFMKIIGRDFITGKIDKPEMESRKKAWLLDNRTAGKGKVVMKRPTMKIHKKPSGQKVDDDD
eukprot:3916974-Pyramimonas_sp.AAC.1